MHETKPVPYRPFLLIAVALLIGQQAMHSMNISPWTDFSCHVAMLVVAARSLHCLAPLQIAAVKLYITGGLMNLLVMVVSGGSMPVIAGAMEFFPDKPHTDLARRHVEASGWIARTFGDNIIRIHFPRMIASPGDVVIFVAVMLLVAVHFVPTSGLERVLCTTEPQTR